MIRIEICGGITSGKTTLANAFRMNDSVVSLERFQENPFWLDFYSDMKRYAFETEIAFLLQHYHQVKLAGDNEGLMICDFSFVLDRAYARVTLPERQLRVFFAVHDEAFADIRGPSLVVHLICDAAVEFDRIRKRGRKVERSISIEYLDAVNRAVAQEIGALPASIPVIEINSGEADFAIDEEVAQEVVGEVLVYAYKRIDETSLS